LTQTPTQTQLNQLVRWRAGLAIAMIVVPLAFFALFERQARRLDALADHGAPVRAQVTEISRDGGITYYTYAVDGKAYDWNVRRSEAPFGIGRVFYASYLPENPSLSRPTVTRSVVAQEALEVRNFAHRAVPALAFILLPFPILVHLRLRRLRVPGDAASPIAKSTWRRHLPTGLVIVPLVVVITGWHLRDALAKGQSIAPVVLALGLVVFVVVGTLWFVGRGGQSQDQARSAKLLTWIVPILLAIGCLKALVLLMGN
jgi:hypothetical protein